MDVSIYTAVTDDGVEAHVFRTGRIRWQVRILDADAGQWLPDGRDFASFEGARIYADMCAR